MRPIGFFSVCFLSSPFPTYLLSYDSRQPPWPPSLPFLSVSFPWYRIFLKLRFPFGLIRWASLVVTAPPTSTVPNSFTAPSCSRLFSTSPRSILLPQTSGNASRAPDIPSFCRYSFLRPFSFYLPFFRVRSSFPPQTGGRPSQYQDFAKRLLFPLFASAFFLMRVLSMSPFAQSLLTGTKVSLAVRVDSFFFGRKRISFGWCTSEPLLPSFFFPLCPPPTSGLPSVTFQKPPPSFNGTSL